ncbi:Conserved_hypothetical protein [Hexamita inflata]|uniref:EGF-like domain-containing protein n=1 Tax=Hexamita inflata TaxID=28002 RepID=A0AA86UN98_9EUKA|nr:Conserved hypothetical protein [Hexamita inflata]
MILYLHSLTIQVFSVAEFDFCYNYVFYEPFQQHMKIVQTTPLEFENPSERDLCQRTENVLFRHVNISQIEFTLDLDVSLNFQPFSLFFFTFQEVHIVNSKVNLRLNDCSPDVSLFVATCPEYKLKILDCDVKVSAQKAQKFYGIGNNFTEPLIINRSAFEYSFQSVDGFYGIAHQVNDLQIQNSGFKFQINAHESCGFSSLVLGPSIFANISISGSLAGNFTYGLIFEAKNTISTSNLTYSLISSGLISNCGFIQLTNSQISNVNLSFINYPITPSEPSSYNSGTCPCIQGAVLSSGLCYCASGSRQVLDNCQCTTLNAFIVDQVCVCGVNATNVSNTCVCPTGSTLINGVCKCAVKDAFPINGVCTCGINASLVNNECVCPQGSILTEGVCKCQTNNAFPENGACKCGVNATNSSNSCVCPTGSILQNGICKCQTNGAFPVNKICQCAKYAANSSNQCVCPAYSTVSNGECSCTPAYSVMNGNQCTCTPIASVMNNGVCTCPAGAVISSGTCKCTTPGSSLSGNQCKCTGDYAFGLWANDGNAWCYNIKMCCSKCLWKTGDNWGCSDDKYHSCSKNNDIVAA